MHVPTFLFTDRGVLLIELHAHRVPLLLANHNFWDAWLLVLPHLLLGAFGVHLAIVTTDGILYGVAAVLAPVASRLVLATTGSNGRLVQWRALGRSHVGVGVGRALR